MDRTMTGLLIIVGMILSFMIGRGYQAAHRAWGDYKDTKAKVPVLLRAFWAAIRAVLVIGMLGLIYMAGSVYLTAGGLPKPAPTTSTPAPRPTR
jgi:uncharacterized membrane protein